MRGTVRRAAVEAGADQQQLLALVVTAPESVRERFRGQNTGAVIATSAGLRPGPARSGDIESSPP